MRKLFLDDTRKPPDFTWDVVKNYNEFVAYITLNGVPDVISFDHDLGQEHYDVYEKTPELTPDSRSTVNEHYNKFTEKTGYDCAKWLVEHHKLPDVVIIHTMNPVGGMNIKFVLDAGYRHDEETAPQPTEAKA